MSKNIKMADRVKIINHDRFPRLAGDVGIVVGDDNFYGHISYIVFLDNRYYHDYVERAAVVCKDSDL